MENNTIAPGEFVVTLSEGGGDLPEYKVLQAEEPIKVNIVDIAKVPGMYPDPETGETKQQLKFALRVAEGQEGEGQIYSLWVNAPLNNFISPKSGLYGKIISKVWPSEAPNNLDITDLLGQPLRIELSAGEPSKKDPSKTYQKITLTKTPTKEQKRITVEAKAPQQDLTAEVLAAFGD